MPRFVALKKLLHKGQKKKKLQHGETSVVLPTFMQPAPLVDVPLPPELEALPAVPVPETIAVPAQPLSPQVPQVLSPQVEPQPDAEQAAPLPPSVQASPSLDSQALPPSNPPEAVPAAIPESTNQGQPQQARSQIQPRPSALQPPLQSPSRVALRGAGEFTIIEENGAYRLTFNANLDRAMLQSLLGNPSTSASNTEAAEKANDNLLEPDKGHTLLPNSAQGRGNLIYHTNVGQKTVRQDARKTVQAAAHVYSPDNDSIHHGVEARRNLQGAPRVETAKPDAKNKDNKPAKRDLESIKKFNEKLGRTVDAANGRPRKILPARGHLKLEREHGDPALEPPAILQNGLFLNPPNDYNQRGALHGAGPVGRSFLDDMGAMHKHPELRPPPQIDPRFQPRVNNPPRGLRLSSRAAIPDIPIVGLPNGMTVPDRTGLTAVTEQQLTPADWDFLHPQGVDINLENGAQGEVTVVKHMGTGKGAGKLFVVKEERFGKLSLPNERSIPTYGHELAIFESRLKNHNHPNIIKYHFSVPDPLRPTLGVCMVLEYCSGGDLVELIQHFKNKLKTFTPRLFIYHFIASMTDALAYLHCGLPPANNATAVPAEAVLGWEAIIHADIKPDNIFIRWSGAELLPDIVLGDFGMSGTQRNLIGQWGGTHGYVAPELERQEPFFASAEMYVGKTMITPACDVYGFGATLYQVVTRELYQPWLGAKGDVDTNYSRAMIEPFTEEDHHLFVVTRFCLHELPDWRYTAFDLYAYGKFCKTMYDEAWEADRVDGLTGPDQWHPEAHDRGRPRERGGGRRDSHSRRSSPNSDDGSDWSSDSNDGGDPPAGMQERQKGSVVERPIHDGVADKAEGQAGRAYPVAVRGNTRIKLTDFLQCMSIRFRPCDCIPDVGFFKHPWHPCHCPPRDRHEKRLSKARQIESATLTEWLEIYGLSTEQLEELKKLEEMKKQAKQKKQVEQKKREQREQREKQDEERQKQKRKEKRKKQKQKRQEKQER